MASFKSFSSQTKKAAEISGFLGVDFTSSPGNIDMRRSPDALNMIRDTPGKNKKRSGYLTEYTFPAEINGIHSFNYKGTEKFLVHAGTELYLKEGDTYTVIYSQMNNARSSSAVLAGKLILIDGATMLSYDGEKVSNIKENAYTPTVIIGRSPSGGGQLYEPINMITGYRIEKFIPDGTSKKYYLSVDNISSVTYVQQRSSSGEWTYLKYDVDYDFNEETGIVTFFTAPPVPSDGGDSILIKYNKINTEYQKIINSCNICTLYGINGAMDRIFLTGASEYPNRDYYCQMDDPTYWGDTWYSTIGRSDGPIIGYSIVSDCLAAHKANEDSNANIILRKGTITDNEPCFPIVGTLPSSGAVSCFSFGTLDNEPVYFSEDGISAITPSDVLGERFSQTRSYFLNGRLLYEENKETASAVTYKGFYMLLLNDNMYILDGLMSASEEGKPFSHRQYEGYFWQSIPGKFLFTNGKNLYAAGKGGKLYRFSDEANFNDDGVPFDAYWEFAEFFGDDFSVLKTVTHVDIMPDNDANNTVLEYKNGNGEWEAITETGKSVSDKILSRRVHIKDCESAKFKIKNVSGNDFKINKLKITYINGKKIR